MTELIISQQLASVGFVQIVVVLVVLGIVWYFLKPYIAEPFGTIATVIIILAVCIWLLRVAGVI